MNPYQNPHQNPNQSQSQSQSQNQNAAPTNPGTSDDGFQPSVPRYTMHHTFKSGDPVIVRICEQTIAKWRHGTVSDMTKYPPRAEANGQLSYPVEYPTKGRFERGWFNPVDQDIHYDTYMSNIGERRLDWK